MSYKKRFDGTNFQYNFNIDRIHGSMSRFYVIFFVDKVSGSLLVSKRYTELSELNLKEDLISNFLSAINSFILEIKNDEIQEINFKDTRILYERRNRLICIALSKKTNLQIERIILHEIVQDFYSKFEREINTFKGIINPEMLKYREKLKDSNLNRFLRFSINY